MLLSTKIMSDLDETFIFISSDIRKLPSINEQLFTINSFNTFTFQLRKLGFYLFINNSSILDNLFKLFFTLLIIEINFRL